MLKQDFRNAFRLDAQAFVLALLMTIGATAVLIIVGYETLFIFSR